MAPARSVGFRRVLRRSRRCAGPGTTQPHLLVVGDHLVHRPLRSDRGRVPGLDLLSGHAVHVSGQLPGLLPEPGCGAGGGPSAADSRPDALPDLLVDDVGRSSARLRPDGDCAELLGQDDARIGPPPGRGWFRAEMALTADFPLAKRRHATTRLGLRLPGLTETRVVFGLSLALYVVVAAVLVFVGNVLAA